MLSDWNNWNDTWVNEEDQWTGTVSDSSEEPNFRINPEIWILSGYFNKPNKCGWNFLFWNLKNFLLFLHDQLAPLIHAYGFQNSSCSFQKFLGLHAYMGINTLSKTGNFLFLYTFGWYFWFWYKEIILGFNIEEAEMWQEFNPSKVNNPFPPQ